MDGDCPNLEELILVSNKHQCYLVVDECFGCFGSTGEGFVQMLELQDHVLLEL
jgi:8-amino-7-oxononanoate synthase